MKLSTAVKALRAHLGNGKSASQEVLATRLGVSHTAVVYWENGHKIGKFNRMLLLAFAREVGAPREVIAAFEAAQPTLRPSEAR